jgi:uncharacterized protein YacL
MLSSETISDSLENWSAMAFVIAGAFLFGDTTLQALEQIAAVSTPGVLRGAFMLSGMLAAIVGLLGFYPRLVDESRRLARAGALVAAVACVTFSVVWVWWIVGNFVPTVSEPIPAINMLAVVTTVLGFLLFGVASLRTDVLSRSVGILLLAIVGVFVGMVVVLIGRINLPAWSIVAVLGVLSVIMLTIGYLLRASSPASNREKPASDSVAP